MTSVTINESTPLHGHSHNNMTRRSSSRRGCVEFKDDHIDMDGSFKAAVFGFNDGLCANTCLMIGIASASQVDPSSVIAAGLVGLLAGAASMGAGEWISATLSNSYEKREVAREREHLQTQPDGEARNLASTLMDDFGFSQKTVDNVFEDMKRGDKSEQLERALRVHAKVEMGLDVEDAGSANPFKSMVFMMASFTLGAAVPLIPWVSFLYAGPVAAVWYSVFCSLIATLTVGMKLAAVTEEPIISTALRQTWAAAIAIFSVWFVGYVYQLATGQQAPAV